MILGLYSIYDSKVGYLPPTDYQSDSAAIRSLEAAILRRTDTMFDTHPQDFTLMCVGTFDNLSGVITPLDPPRHIDSVSAMHQRLFHSKIGGESDA